MTAKQSLNFLGFAIWLATALMQVTVHAQGYYGGDRVGRYAGPNDYYGQGLPPVMAPGQQPTYQNNQGLPQGIRPPSQPQWGQSYEYGYQDRCQQARIELRQAYDGLLIATNNLYNLGDMCKGESLCTLGYQNVFNQAVSNKENAQKKVDTYCSGGGGRPF